MPGEASPPLKHETFTRRHSRKPRGFVLPIARSAAAAAFLLTLAIGAPAADAPSRVTLTLSDNAGAVPPGPFAPDWDSIRANYRVPAWLRDGKFGIFLHWGLYAVPAHGSEWHARHMYATRGVIDWHRENFGPQDKFGYKDFIPRFTARNYDPVAWVELFKQAGARYVMPVAEHHDGFAMYDSALTRWDAKDMGPKRDLLGDLAQAMRDAGLVFCLSNHRMEHWSFMYPAAGLATDLFDPANAEFYGPPQPPAERAQGGQEVFEGRAAPQSPAFLEEWLRRNQELVDKYRPQMVFFDNGVNARALDEIKLRFAAYYYNRAAEWGLEATITTKRDAYLAGTVKDYERGRAVETTPEFWQCDTSIAHNSWGYIDGIVYRNAGEMIRELVDCVSKNGAYLLNLAPRADGTIPEEQQLRLLQIGEWLRQNGEAIYASRPWIVSEEGPTKTEPRADRGLVDGMLKVYTPQDIRFTTREGHLYAILFAWPADNNAVITSLALSSSNGLATGAAGAEGEITSVSLLGSTQRVEFTRDAAGLKVKLPAWKPNEFAHVLKITGLNAKSPLP